MTQIQQIQLILQKQIGFHRQLLEVVRLERESLINADLKAIQECTFAKEGLIESIRGAESERMRMVGELAMIWRKPAKDLTLNQIIIEIQGKDLKLADQLRSSLTTLSIMVQRISEQNKANREIVDRSMVHINAMKKNVLGESTPRSDTYSSQGQKISPQSSSRLISKEA
jgi:hypothetical protein